MMTFCATPVGKRTRRRPCESTPSTCADRRCGISGDAGLLEMRDCWRRGIVGDVGLPEQHHGSATIHPRATQCEGLRRALRVPARRSPCRPLPRESGGARVRSGPRAGHTRDILRGRSPYSRPSVAPPPSRRPAQPQCKKLPFWRESRQEPFGLEPFGAVHEARPLPNARA